MPRKIFGMVAAWDTNAEDYRKLTLLHTALKLVHDKERAKLYTLRWPPKGPDDEDFWGRVDTPQLGIDFSRELIGRATRARWHPKKRRYEWLIFSGGYGFPDSNGARTHVFLASTQLHRFVAKLPDAYERLRTLERLGWEPSKRGVR